MEQKTIKEASSLELKAVAYDVLSEIGVLQNQYKLINQEILSRNQPVVQDEAVTVPEQDVVESPYKDEEATPEK